MKRLPKLLCFLSVAVLATSCNIQSKAPTLLALDLSDAILVFNGNNCTGKLEKKEDGYYYNREGLKTIDFHIYKTDENGVTSRVHCKTKRNDDDPYYTSETFFTEFNEISKDYFYADLGRYTDKNKYLINKKTGNAIKFPDDYQIYNNDWIYTVSTMETFPQDGAGNFYGYLFERSSKSYVVAKLSILEKEVKSETIGKMAKTDTPNFAVDKDGNVAYRGYGGNLGADVFITSNKKVIKLSDKKISAFWSGYDSAIYAFEKGNIEKLVYDKDNDVLNTEIVATIPALANKNIYPEQLVFLDGLKQIYYYETSQDKSLVLYQFFGENLQGEPTIITEADLKIDNDYADYKQPERYYVKSDEDTMYVTLYQGIFVMNKISPAYNMEVSKVTYDVEYNDGTRVLSNKKMSIFYWNHNEINTPGDGGAYMSIGVYDLNTGILSPQDSFITGNSDRTKVINLK